MRILLRYCPVGRFHDSEIRGTVFHDSGSSLLPSSEIATGGENIEQKN